MHKIAIGCDPNAAKEKMQIMQMLQNKGYEVVDYGSNDVIYANVAKEVATAVAEKKQDRGILICGTGIGMCLAANKVKGVLAALIGDVYSAQRARMSNDANVACFGAFTLGMKLMETLVETFLTCEFEQGGASQAKVDRIREIENM